MNSELISVSPQRLIFYAPYDRTQKRIITILNPTSSKLLFKIRSNVQWKYNTSPNCGFIQPYDISEVDISLSYFGFHEDQKYCHRFCVQCIRSPSEEVTEPKSILCIFKQMHHSEIHSVRIPVELQPEPIRISQSELDTMFQPDVQSMLRKSQPISRNYLDHLRQMTVPTKQKKRCGWLRFLITVLIIVSCLVGAYLHRQQIEENLHMHLKMDNLQY